MEIRLHHRPDDPWSHLLLQALPPLLATYDVRLRCATVPLPPREHFPRPELVAAHALRDARDLARHCALRFEAGWRTPAPGEAALASRRLLAAESQPAQYLELALALGEALFAGDTPRLRTLCEGAWHEDRAREALAGHQRRQLADGHYLGGMLCFGDAWYWGVDRLAHLEHDLLVAGLRRPGTSVGVLRRRALPLTAHGNAAPPRTRPLDIDFFCTFRSPYAYLAAQRCFALQQRYPVRIRPRLMLPMKMAGYPIPEIKAAYFRFDPAREALRHGMRFGNFCDPFGRGLERAMALAAPAEAAGRLEPYLLSVMQGVWADGIDTATDAGLGHLVERAGLDWAQLRPHVDDDSWRAQAAANRSELERLGQYAAPTFRLAEWVTWGQDRLWMLEREIESRLAAQPEAHP